MCGISGVFAFTPKSGGTLDLIQSATDTLAKRGPDNGNIYKDQTVALGHRRLSIIDVSSVANQPMVSQNGRYVIVFNGEIFNYKELRLNYLTEEERSNLISSSDTEIFLVLYQRIKEKVFPLLRGFFAAAIYDKQNKSLVLVRDRFGEKPLLYFMDEDKLCFASEMKALFAFNISAKINWDILPAYLQLNYIPQPFSLIESVRKLQPGYYLTVNKNGVTCESYFTLKVQPEKYGKLSYNQAQNKLVDLMREAVQLRLISDVPLGAFLSGGIDSSVIVALASAYTTKLKTFSIGYKDHPFFDETFYANLVAHKYNTDHTVFSLTNNDFLEHIDNILKYIDEPFADSSAIPEFILSYYTRKHVTVTLSGDGGDEVFAGYNKHAAELRVRNGGVLNSLVKMGSPIWNLLPKSRNNRIANKVRQLQRFSNGSKLNPGDRYWQWASIRSYQQALSLLNSNIKSRIQQSGIDLSSMFLNDIKGSDFNEILLADMNLVLLSDMLVKVDSMSMANGLEIRSPFLDQQVVDFAFGLPAEYKIDSKIKKRIVQDAFRNFLPIELYNRPKHGFEIPLLDWLRKELWGLIDNNLLKKSFIAEQQIFDVEAIENLKRKLKSSNPEDSHATIWALIVFQHWWKQYFS